MPKKEIERNWTQNVLFVCSTPNAIRTKKGSLYLLLENEKGYIYTVKRSN
jgi:hypothetical protein